MTAAPYGSWRSPISAASLVEQAVGLSQLLADNGSLYWNERRPTEAGRQVVVRRGLDGVDRDVVPAPFSARTRVHEYGGQSYCVASGTLFFSEQTDQRVYRIDPGAEPIPITAEPEQTGGDRYVDFAVAPSGTAIYAVRERHGITAVENDIVVLDPSGATAPMTVASGHDFYAAPHCSPDGGRLAFLAWDHPHMPWDSTVLYIGDLDPSGVLGSVTVVAGGPGESVSRRAFASDGSLWYLSDRSDYWALYGEDGQATSPVDAEFGGPDWVLGQCSYVFLPNGRVFGTRFSPDGEELGYLSAGGFEPIGLNFSLYSGLATDDGRCFSLAGSASEPLALIEIDLEHATSRVLRSSREIDLAGYLSEPRSIAFPTTDGATAHALYYPPVNVDFSAPDGELPPLIVQSHGGPTSAALALFDLNKQFFTSRGFAIVDVDYGGSTGYGRAYRKRLEGNWGIVDVADCAAAASYLVTAGLADPDRLIIRGGSAGGYTTLAALAFTDTFAAGASHYGVSDLASLATDTHKFESRYLDRLVGPYPEAADRYRERSPLEHADGISCPVIFFQGLDDPVVPPDQAERMVDALRSRGVPVAYLTFAGESHGFRQATTIVQVALAELAFFGAVFGFSTDGLEQLEIENADAISVARRN